MSFYLGGFGLGADLSKDTNPFEFVNEGGANLTLENVVENVAEHPAVIIEALEGDFLSNIVCGVRHCGRELVTQHSTTHNTEKGVTDREKERKRRERECVCCVCVLCVCFLLVNWLIIFVGVQRKG